MKNIIIAGASRTGKTTLATRLNEELNYFVVSRRIFTLSSYGGLLFSFAMKAS
jgi:adenylate kinase family enzyme